MNTTQLPFLVEGILILTAGVFGVLLARAGRPFGKVKLIVHLFFFLWFSVGFGFIAHGLLTMSSATMGIWIPVVVMGLAIVSQLVTGILLVASRKAQMRLPKIHLTSAILMFAANLCALIIAGFR